MAQAPPPKRQKTALAEKYGHPTQAFESGQTQDAIADHLLFKSGLTPVELGPFLYVEEKDRSEALQEYQRERFHGNLSRLFL